MSSVRKWIRQTLTMSMMVYALIDAQELECECRHTPPQLSNPTIQFCTWYKSSTCCLPAHDFDMGNKFLAFIEAGPTCSKYQNKAKLYLAMAFCYGCSPDEPYHFTEPLNTQFFGSTGKTVKICRSVADNLAPKLFDDCGFMLPDDRETICSPNSPVVPSYTWPDCDDGSYVCQSNDDKTWYCSSVPCPSNHVPPNFQNVPCNISEQTCGGALKLLNDNRAAKPPNYEDYAVEFVDVDLCRRQHANASRCRCMDDPLTSSGHKTLRIPATTLLIHLLIVLMVFR